MSAALLTDDAPRWLVLVLVGLVAAAYAACGLLVLVGRARRGLDRSRRRSTTGVRLEVTS